MNIGQLGHKITIRWIISFSKVVYYYYFLNYMSSEPSNANAKWPLAQLKLNDYTCKLILIDQQELFLSS